MVLNSVKSLMGSRRGSRAAALTLALAIGVFALGVLIMGPRPVSAAAPSVAAGTLTACNGEENAGGTGVRCTITVTNYVTNSGALAAEFASTWTVTRCTGAAGVIAPPAAGGTCATTTLPITGQPITTVQQCNGSGSGGGGGVWCIVTIANHFTTAPGNGFTPATVYECVSVPLTPGLVCDPTAGNNTAASVPAATVGQCNGSGNGGGLVPAVPAGSAHCAMGAGSTTTATLPVHVDQCNGSANGGGAFLKCTATVTNDVIAPPPAEEIEVVVPVIPPPAAVPPVVVLVPVAPGVVPATPPQAIVLPPLVVPPGVPRVVLPPIVVPPGVVQVIVPVVLPPKTVPLIITQLIPPIVPPKTGNAGLAGAGSDSTPQMWLLGSATVGLLLAARRLRSRR